LSRFKHIAISQAAEEGNPPFGHDVDSTDKPATKLVEASLNLIVLLFVVRVTVASPVPLPDIKPAPTNGAANPRVKRYLPRMPYFQPVPPNPMPPSIAENWVWIKMPSIGANAYKAVPRYLQGKSKLSVRTHALVWSGWELFAFSVAPISIGSLGKAQNGKARRQAETRLSRFFFVMGLLF